MATIKGYTRSDRLGDFLDACVDFAQGGELAGRSFSSLKTHGAIDALWSHEVAELVEMDQIGKGALNWKPLTDLEKGALFDHVDKVAARSASVAQVAPVAVPVVAAATVVDAAVRRKSRRP